MTTSVDREVTKQNKVIATITNDIKGDLLRDVEPGGIGPVGNKCPELYIKLEDIPVTSLIDTGSEITCISKQFYLNNIETFKNCPQIQ